MALYDFGKKLVGVVFSLFYQMDVTFLGNLPEGKGFILACNHISDLDPVMLGLAFPKNIRFMAKSELFKIPVLGPVIRGLGAFPVARGKGDHGAINQAVEIVKDGGVLGIFPEGGRSKDGKFHKVKSGTVVVASQTGADILPAAISYEKRRFFHRRRVRVLFGEVISNQELCIETNSKSELREANRILGGAIGNLLGVAPE